MSEIRATEILSVTHTTHQISAEDKEVAHEFNLLAKEALVYARRTLRFGSPAEKLRIATAALSASARLATVDSKVEVEARRDRLQAVFDEIQQVEEKRIVVTGPDAPVEEQFVYVEPKTLDGHSHDQGHEH